MLLGRLEASLDSNVIAYALDDLTVHAENAARDNKTAIVSEILVHSLDAFAHNGKSDPRAHIARSMEPLED